MTLTKQFFSLTKFILSTAVTLSALLSFFAYKGELNSTIILPTIAIWLLALGVSALNQVQEYKEDALMPRTKNRPIASGIMSVKTGLIISLSLILGALILGYLELGLFGLAIFVATVFIYNFAYTNLKKISVYSAIYGALLGVIPPLVGWIVAGGQISDVRFLAIALLYFIWQIPHTWLLVLKFHKDYKSGGFNTVVDTFGIEPLKRITFIWILITMVIGLFVIYSFNITSIYLLVAVAFIHLYILFSSFKNLLKSDSYKRVFIEINIYILYIMIILCLRFFI
ncbi:MAG: Unknown protein [uncultured Campylobacterales bacterium]|uniref:heme o synthase n=1 Tax=uncultured Campylobacterales bacterium TaxID=352960 RepID=A0A6S6T0G1_9BACT|nr:MAG: Unknown protein [uncultured Campylobacterales bacterium]